MKLRRLLILVIAGCVGSFVLARDAAAKEPFAEFLRALQKRGYGEQGLGYLDQVADRPDFPDELKTTLDLERSKCLRIAANEAYDSQQRLARLAEAKRLAEKFFTEHPTHPAAGGVLLHEGDDALARGEQRLALARSVKDKDLRAKSYQDSRTALTEARGRFEGAATRLKERLDALEPKPAATDKPDPKAQEQRDELALPWVEARSKAALSEYLQAQTIDKPGDAERKKLLERAGEAFDGVYQEFRGRQIGLLAHMWHGKTLEDLGDAVGALELYDEVLVASPDGKDADPELAPLFGQAELFRLQLVAKTAQPVEILKEGEEWLREHKKWQATSAYQGIALEMVRTRLKSAERLRLGSDRNKGLRECVIALNTIGKVESEFRHEAMLLRREVIAKLGTGAALSLQEALALGDEAASDKNWTEAESFFRESLELARKANDAKNTEAAKSRLAQALYRQAVDLYGARNMEKVLALCGELVRDNPDLPLAEDTSALAIGAALAEYSDAADKDAAFARLDRVAGYALHRWPNKPVADDARMALAQVALLKNDYASAEERLQQVNNQSARYATALQILGQVRWRQYLTTKKAGLSQDKPRDIAKLREEAITFIKTSLDRQRAAWQTSEPMPATLFDTQLLLAEMAVEGQDWPGAAALFKPLVDVMKSSRPITIDRSGQRTLVGAIRAWLLTGELKPAAEATDLLIAISHDEEQPNGILVELTKLVAQEARKAAATADPATESAASNSAALRELQIKLADALAPRKALSIAQLTFVGDACMQLDRNQEARDLYERLLVSVDRDESAKATAGPALTGIRARFVRILRSEGKLDEAAAQASALIKEHPSALEPLMEKCYILQSLAEREPRRYDECIAHWTELRVRLGRMKTRPPEYYEVLYNTALCLVRQARASGDKTKASQAEQILKSTLTLSPQLSGPDMVAKFDSLLAQTTALRGNSAK